MIGSGQGSAFKAVATAAGHSLSGPTTILTQPEATTESEWKEKWPGGDDAWTSRSLETGVGNIGAVKTDEMGEGGEEGIELDTFVAGGIATQVAPASMKAMRNSVGSFVPTDRSTMYHSIEWPPSSPGEDVGDNGYDDYAGVGGGDDDADSVGAVQGGDDDTFGLDEDERNFGDRMGVIGDWDSMHMRFPYADAKFAAGPAGSGSPTGHLSSSGGGSSNTDQLHGAYNEVFGRSREDDLDSSDANRQFCFGFPIGPEGGHTVAG